MFIRPLPNIIKDHVWSKVLTLGLILFLVFFADAILSFWVPNFLQDSLQSSLMMGLVMSFSSLIGLLADLIFPQILRGVTVKKLITYGIISSILFSLLLIKAISSPLFLTLILAVSIWGIYYELLGFGEQQFISDSTPLKLHSAVWGVLTSFRSMAYFLGPIVGGFMFSRGSYFPPVFAIIFALLGLTFLLATGSHHKRPVDIEIKEVNLVRELSHWRVLFVHVWPVVILSLLMGFVDATFWTTGAVWTEKLAEENILGGFFLPFYTLPSMFMGFLVSRWGIYQGKKKMAEKFLIFSGVFLAMLGVSELIPFQLLFVFASSSLLAIAFPLTDAVYSDIVSRMGRERKHLIGLSRSSISISYIIGPILAGFIASRVGERMTFSIVGMIVVFVSTILLFVTPKKLKLPQVEIKSWEE